MSTLQNSWGDYVHVYKFEQGKFCPEDIVRISAAQVLVSLHICSGSSDTSLFNNVINKTIPCAAVR